MTEQRQQKQREQPSIRTQLNDLQAEVRSLRSALERHVAQPHRQREAAKAARPAEHACAAGNAVEAARIGILQLGEAVLDILLEGMQENRPVELSEITRRTGLPGGGDAQKDWPAWSLLQKLVGENRAAHAGHGNYELTRAELDLRRKRRGGNSPETTARLGLLQVENAILACLQNGVPTADITHQLQLPVNASHFLRVLAAENRVTHGAHGQYAVAERAEADKTDRG
ncbi:MAG: hypothetical protein F4Y84_17210 [Caldilineaceae bacterium SB0665_bin_25]|nr:hypothetical protein [Caldilineaceae bacterium SB0665_bin_25]